MSLLVYSFSVSLFFFPIKKVSPFSPPLSFSSLHFNQSTKIKFPEEESPFLPPFLPPSSSSFSFSLGREKGREGGREGTILAFARWDEWVCVRERER